MGYLKRKSVQFATSTFKLHHAGAMLGSIPLPMKNRKTKSILRI